MKKNHTFLIKKTKSLAFKNPYFANKCSPKLSKRDIYRPIRISSIYDLFFQCWVIFSGSCISKRFIKRLIKNFERVMCVKIFTYSWFKIFIGFVIKIDPRVLHHYLNFILRVNIKFLKQFLKSPMFLKKTPENIVTSGETIIL
jgi:hypothetical protein